MPLNGASDTRPSNECVCVWGGGGSEMEPFLSFCVRVKPPFLGNLALNNKSLENEKKILKMEAHIVEGTLCEQSKYYRNRG